MKNDLFDYAILDTKKLIEELKTDQTQGLSGSEVQMRLAQYGQNELTNKTVTPLAIFLRQFRSSFMYLLITATFMSTIFGEIIDSLAILIFIVVNALLGFIQEYRSEQALKMLKSYVVPKVKVLRDGIHTLVDANSLVPGDIVILETGDRVSADIRVLLSEGVIADESVITGESISVVKTDVTLDATPQAYYEARNLVFTGTSIVKGRLVGVVLKTGSQSSLGTISKLTTETMHISEFTKGIDRFSNFILRLIVITLVFVFIANLIIKDTSDIPSLVIFSIALAVSVIPEALPLVTTISLSRGALRLAKKKVVVRRLSAIEDLGGIEVLCTDKTGTITENRLTYVYGYESHKFNSLWTANLASSQLEQKTEPFDVAAYEGLSEEQKKESRNITVIGEVPFDPEIRRNIVCVKNREDLFIVTRGAPEVVIPLCQIDKITEEQLTTWIKKEGREGHRLLALGVKKISKTPTDIDALTSEESYDFAGILAFDDPIKQTTPSAIKNAEKLGIQIKIITGDAKEVAGAVAYRIGLTKDPDDVLTGLEFASLEFEQQIQALNRYHVFARITPEQKNDIIQKMQTVHTVGFLGEGINDAPALKAAGVSMVVPSASDIAREVADFALLDNDLGVIIDGIKLGREIFVNTIKYLRVTLASNFGNFYAIAIGSLFIDFLPMLPLQILLLNLLSDLPMIAIATDTVDKSEVTRPLKYNVREVVTISTMFGLLSTVFDVMYFYLFYRISPEVLQTNWFMASVISELVILFALRSKLPILRATPPSKTVLGLSASALIITIILPFTSTGQNVFGLISPLPQHLIIIFMLISTELLLTEIIKRLYSRYLDSPKR